MISEIGKNVVIRYSAQTAQAQAEVKKLAKVQEKHAGELKTQQAEEIAGLESKIAKYTKYAVIATGVFAAVKVSMDAMKFALDQEELRSKTEGHSMDELRVATRGLVDEIDLMKLAQKANFGVMKTGALDLITLAKAMDVYRENGYDAAKITEDFGEYLQTGKASALKNYGLQIDEARGSVGQYKQVMEQLTEVAKEQSKIEEDGGDRMKQRAVRMKDASDKLKEAFGNLVVVLEPAISFLSAALAMIAEGWGLILENIKEAIDWVDRKLDGVFSVSAATKAASKAEQKIHEAKIAAINDEIAKMHEAQQIAFDALESRITQSYLSLASPEWQAKMSSLGKILGEHMGGGLQAAVTEKMQQGMSKFLGLLGIGNEKKDDKKQRDEGRKPKGVRVPIVITTIDDVEIDILKAKKQYQSMVDDMIRESNDLRGGVSKVSLGVEAEAVSFNAPALTAAMDAQAELARMAAEANAHSESVLRKMFGDPKDIEMYATGLQTLQQAGQAAFAAFITGSESAGEAFRKMVAGNMLNLASEMFGRSIYEGAMALGSLAMGNFAGAASHGAAAAKYAAGAVVLGGIAASMGAGASGAGASGAATNSSLPASTSSAINAAPGTGGGRSVTVVVGDDFADDSPRKRQQRAQRLVNLGLRTEQDVVYS